MNFATDTVTKSSIGFLCLTKLRTSVDDTVRRSVVALS